MGLFDEKDEIQTMQMPDIKKAKRQRKQKMRIALRQESCNEIFALMGGLPNHEESFEIICNGNFDTIAFFEYILAKCERIDELFIATWIINRDNAKRIFECIDNRSIGNATFIISTRTKQLRKQDWGFIIEGIIDRKQKVRIAHTHAKVFSCASHKKGTYITVAGSGNWNLNRRIENYTVTNSKELFDFHKDWMNQVIELP